MENIEDCLNKIIEKGVYTNFIETKLLSFKSQKKRYQFILSILKKIQTIDDLFATAKRYNINHHYEKIDLLKNLEHRHTKIILKDLFIKISVHKRKQKIIKLVSKEGIEKNILSNIDMIHTHNEIEKYLDKLPYEFLVRNGLRKNPKMIFDKQMKSLKPIYTAMS